MKFQSLIMSIISYEFIKTDTEWQTILSLKKCQQETQHEFDHMFVIIYFGRGATELHTVITHEWG